MKPPLKILIVDDHPLFRQGLRQAVETYPGSPAIYEAGDGHAALQTLREVQPDICILDIQMPELDGLHVIREARARRWKSQIIVLTMYNQEDIFNAAMDLGVKGYVLKESAVSDILHAIRTVLAGHSYVSPTLADHLLNRRAATEALEQQKPGLHRLTPVERRILRLIAEDKTSKQIADELGLSPRTIENHRTNICAKLEVHGIHSLVKFAFENKSRLPE